MRHLFTLLRFRPTDFVFIFGGYCIAFLVVEFSIEPLQAWVLPQTTAFASILFLPHGVRVLSVWMFRGRAFVPLFLAHLFIYSLFFWHDDSFLRHLGMISVGTLCAYLALGLFLASGINLSLQNFDIIHWRAILLLGLVASIFNSVGNSLIMMNVIDAPLQLETMVIYLIGDTLGVFALLLVLGLGLRIFRGVQGAG